jgi:hypothetical protein
LIARPARAFRFGLTAFIAGLACSTTLTTTGACWARGSASRSWNNGCFTVKDEDDDDDKDDDQDTKKQHSIRWGHFVGTLASPHPTGDASVPRTPLSMGEGAKSQNIQ